MIVSDIIKEFSPHLFWDVDRSQLDIDKSREQIICQVLEFGLMNDWEFLKRIYTKEKIKEVVLNLRTMDKVTLSSLANYFKLDKHQLILSVAWALLIMSWCVPLLIKNKRTGSFIGVVLSGISLGMFIADTIYQLD
jgi:hypothetical protein